MKEIEFPRSYVVWDLETSGLDPVKDKVLEIGAIEVMEGVIIGNHRWVLNHGIDIPEFITNINGMTREIVEKEGIEPDRAFRQFMKIMNWGKKVHVTHNGIRFDIPFLIEGMKSSNKEVQFQASTLKMMWELETNLYANAIDTAVLVKGGKLKMKRLWNESFKEYADRVMSVFAKGVKYNVGLCCEEMGIDKSNVILHRAGGDCELTNEIYKKLVL